MNPDEQRLHYPSPTPPHPAHGSRQPGPHWVRMPLPFALDHINLWVLDDEIDGRPAHDHRQRHHVGSDVVGLGTD
jgi:hypothetical protein